MLYEMRTLHDLHWNINKPRANEEYFIEKIVNGDNKTRSGQFLRNMEPQNIDDPLNLEAGGKFHKGGSQKKKKKMEFSILGWVVGSKGGHFP